jgi:hypothetical protein
LDVDRGDDAPGLGSIALVCAPRPALQKLYGQALQLMLPLVTAENLVQCAFWIHADLEKMKLSNSGVYDKFIAIIGCDLVRKLKHRNDQHVDLITKLDFVI